MDVVAWGRKMARRKHRFFWHVPVNAWTVATTMPANGLMGTANVFRDVVIPLVDTNLPAALESDVPERDQFVIERIVGQYMFHSNEVAGVHRMVAHRIYPVTADASAITIRDLWLQDDAESDFLWHKIDPDVSQANGDQWGSWGKQTTGGSSDANHTLYMGRFGHVDVKVGRRLREGEALIWHSQWTDVGGGEPSSDTKWVSLWLRLLVREG